MFSGSMFIIHYVIYFTILFCYLLDNKDSLAQARNKLLKQRRQVNEQTQEQAASGNTFAPRRLFPNENNDATSVTASSGKRTRDEIESENLKLKSKILKLEEDLEDAAREVSEKDSEIMALKEDLQKFRHEGHLTPIADRKQFVLRKLYTLSRNCVF